MSTHPVHLVDNQGQSFPTALIPFCSFAGDRNILGRKMEGISVPVCISFKPTLFEGRKCYSLDVNDILSKENIGIKHGKSYGLSLLIDTNKDRHFGYFESMKKEEAVVYIETLESLQVIGGGNIALTDIKNVQGDEAYYAYAAKEKVCQNKEESKDCEARKFLETLQKICKCMPFELQMLTKVM